MVVTEGCAMILLYGRPLGDREGGKSDERSQETCLLRGISDLLPTDLLSCKSDLMVIMMERPAAAMRLFILP